MIYHNITISSNVRDTLAALFFTNYLWFDKFNSLVIVVTSKSNLCLSVILFC